MAILVALSKEKGGIPPTIFLQLDNTTKQNKSKYLVAFCELLVYFKVCKEIYINFLPVGHTHEDIDQFFSRLAMLLRRTDALSIEHLARIIPTSYKTQEGFRPTVQIWQEMANISGWFTQTGLIQKLKNIMSYRAFWIQKGSNGKTIVQVKDTMSERVKGDLWRGPSDQVPTSTRKNPSQQELSLPYPEVSGTCWKKGIIPDILQAARQKEIPDAQPCEPPPGRTNKHIDGLEKLNALPLLHYPEVDRVSNLALVALEAKEVDGTPSWPLPFNWDYAQMEAIFSGDCSAAPPLPPPVVPMVIAPGKPKVEILLGRYYLIKPSYKDNYPFYLGKLHSVEEAYVEGEPRMYQVHYLWPAVSDQGVSFNSLKNFVDCQYQVHAEDQLIDEEEICQEIIMNGDRPDAKKRAKKWTRLSIAVEGDRGRVAARAWGVKLGKGRNLHGLESKDYEDYHY